MKDKTEPAIMEEMMKEVELWKGEMGSRLWGFSTPESDRDVLRVVVRDFEGVLWGRGGKATTTRVGDEEVVTWDLMRWGKMGISGGITAITTIDHTYPMVELAVWRERIVPMRSALISEDLFQHTEGYLGGCLKEGTPKGLAHAYRLAILLGRLGRGEKLLPLSRDERDILWKIRVGKVEEGEARELVRDVGLVTKETKGELPAKPDVEVIRSTITEVYKECLQELFAW